jgi:CheY-like chemotaxis protein
MFGEINANLGEEFVREASKGLLFCRNAHLEGNKPPDLIVLDLNLPGMPSSKFLDWARSSPSIQKVPIAIYTGSGLVSDKTKAEVRATFYKSSMLSEIRATVQQMCGLVINE